MILNPFAFICLLSTLTTVFSETGESEGPAYPRVLLETTEGEIILELYPDAAPITVANFLSYVNSGFYNMTLFHRIIPNFMIQGGGFISGMEKKQPGAPIKNEGANGLLNEKGTVAMARTNDINSATSQFFINLVDNKHLDHVNKTEQGFGYCVFGRVIHGLEVVEKIAQIKTRTVSYYQNVPVQEVLIFRAKTIESPGMEK